MKKILVVDDDAETINFLRMLLARQGYQVITAKDGPQALSLAKGDPPDLIILDVMMPGLDGYQVTRDLRASPKTANIPILMFTVKNQISDKVSGYEAGVDIYLTKPVHPVELTANIRALLTYRGSRSDRDEEQTYVVGVMAAKGGSGVSTMALNLAITYQKKFIKQTIAAELRPGQGSWALELGLNNTNGLEQILQMNPAEITASRVGECLLRTSYETRLLLASNQVDTHEHFAAIPQYEAMLKQLPRLAQLVVLDIGTTYLPAFDAAANLCQEIILLIEPQPMTVKRSRILMEELKHKGFGSTKILTPVIFNRARADMALSLTQVEEILGQAVALGIPPANELAFAAMNRSLPISMIQPESTLNQQFGKLAEQIGQHIAA